MRLLIVTGIFPPEIGGSATYSALLRHELPRSGVAVSVLTYGSARGERVFCVSQRWPKGLRHLIYFFRALALALRHDVVLAADASVGAGFMTALALTLAPRPFAVRVTGDYAWEQGVQRFGVRERMDEFQAVREKAAFPVRVLSFCQAFTLRRAALVIAPSRYLKGIVAGWGVPEKKIAVIYNAFERPTLARSRQSVKQSLGLTGYTMVAAGRLLPWKGFGLLIKLWAELRSTLDGWNFIIVGDGPERDRLEALNRKVDAGIVFTGVLPRERLLEYLCASDLFVLNTAYEGFSHQLLEALSMGLAVLTTRVGGNGEVIADGRNGFLVDYNDTQAFRERLVQLAGDGALRERLGEEAVRTVSTFSVQRMVGETLQSLGRL
ncbi:MAG: glycosyltransferase family 4 protein [bacterium]|nr:glycosyltransferase family 4 protein [bacterium]MDZ4296190.1 glycosyltransferase family 4 protein [Patescibacteria group bacterium]